MKSIIIAIKTAWMVYKKPELFQEGMFRLLEGQFKFLNDTANENRPMVAQLGNIYWENKEKKETKLLSLWCGIGDSSPIERCKELASENTKLVISNSKLIEQLNDLKRKYLRDNYTTY